MIDMRLSQLADLIKLERVIIVDQNEDFYSVRHGNSSFSIYKDSQTSFDLNLPHYSQSINTELRLEQRLIAETRVFQDENVDEAYKEVMMFHEIREMEYKEAGFEDSHPRAMNDEVLYVLRFFGEKEIKGYFDWAKEYRKSNDFSSLKKNYPISMETAVFCLEYQIAEDFRADIWTTDEMMARKLIEGLKGEKFSYRITTIRENAAMLNEDNSSGNYKVASTFYDTDIDAASFVFANVPIGSISFLRTEKEIEIAVEVYCQVLKQSKRRIL